MKTLLVLAAFIALFSITVSHRQITVFTIGDSTMADKKHEVYPVTGWCQVLNLFFDEGVRVKNHAVNGRSSKSFINEGRWKAERMIPIYQLREQARLHG